MRRLLGGLSPADVAALPRPIDVPSVLAADLDDALARTRPAVDAETVARYEAWDAAHGSGAGGGG